jgi:signal transduction histidine kinase
VRTAVRAATHQAQLIGDVLEVFWVERSAYPRSAKDARGAPDACAAIQRVVKQLEPMCRSRNARLQVERCESPQPVRAEDRRLTRVVGNLVENALRNGPEGGVVQVQVRPEGGWVWIGVEDQGPPVPIERLPELFARLARRRPCGAPGAALGLYFCRITVEAWGGGIGYEPSEAGGARFWVRLPAAVPPP